AQLENVNNVVLDEADEMLNMGFSESINAIFENVPEDRNTLLFSATMSKDIEKIALNYLHDHKEIVVGSRNEGAEHVNHIYYLVNAKDKYLALKRIVDFYPRIFAIIFCRTKLETQDIADKLIKDGYNAEALHGDLSQQQRDLTMQKFRNHTVQFLVATDVAARGLDVDDLTHVINYGLPDDVASYTHRSGRTGRAGKKGTSISIIHTREKFKVRQIEKQIGKDFVDGVLPTPEEICKKQLFKTMDDIMKTDVDEDQIAPYMAEINRQFEYIDKEDIIKKMVTITFGKFLDYYKNAPEIVKPESGKGSRNGEGRGSRGERGKVSGGRRKHETEAGFKRLFINLGKADGFYPGEIMQYLNKHVKGRQEVGHIDLLSKFAYIEVPEEDAKRVMKALNGTEYKGRTVRCNDADEEGHGRGSRGGRSAEKGSRGRRGSDDARSERGGRGSRGSEKGRGGKKVRREEETGDWRQFFQNNDNVKFKGEEPNFEEEGWARRRPKKK
uniref:DEAD/DEAH box helicase n=1 Tax=Segatella hominis TaxID=2518605 RepID=UPI00402899B2